MRIAVDLLKSMIQRIFMLCGMMTLKKCLRPKTCLILDIKIGKILDIKEFVMMLNYYFQRFQNGKFLPNLAERNTQRYVDIQNHGQKIDGKNMLHCIRLLQCANDILDLKTINVRVKNPEYLLSIRHGKVSLEELLESARNQIKGLKQKFEDSDLPHSVDPDLVKSILNEIRKESLNLF